MKTVNLLKDAYKETKKQTSRMIKCYCSECSYQVYTTRKQINRAAPICPIRDCKKYLDNLIANK